MLIIKKGKRETTGGTNQVNIRTLGEKENYKYLEMLEADIIKQTEKEIRKEDPRKRKKIKNLI